MYSGLLPKDLSEDELSPDEEEDEEEESVKGSCEGSAGKSDCVVETPSIPTATNTDISNISNFPSCDLPGVSKEMWKVC